jgi:hypothetical protein
MSDVTSTKVGEVTFLNRSGRKSETMNCMNPVYTSADFGQNKPYPERPGYSPLNNVAPFNKHKYDPK